jgi:hypothetical protein
MSCRPSLPMHHGRIIVAVLFSCCGIFELFMFRFECKKNNGWQRKGVNNLKFKIFRTVSVQETRILPTLVTLCKFASRLEPNRNKKWADSEFLWTKHLLLIYGIRTPIYGRSPKKNEAMWQHYLYVVVVGSTQDQNRRGKTKKTRSSFRSHSVRSNYTGRSRYIVCAIALRWGEFHCLVRFV